MKIDSIIAPASLSSGNTFLHANSSCASTHDIFSTSSKLDFPYIIPNNSKQQCNIYGATCQQGSITIYFVAASNCQASLVTIPCSSYLASQSTFLYTASLIQTTPIPWLTSWEAAFGRSPECHSFQDQLHSFYDKLYSLQDQLHEIGTVTPWIFTECSGKESLGSVTQVSILPPQVPPFVMNVGLYECCGGCHLDTPEVRLYYFAENGGSGCPSNVSSSAGLDVLSARNYSTGGFSTTWSKSRFY